MSKYVLNNSPNSHNSYDNSLREMDLNDDLHIKKFDIKRALDSHAKILIIGKKSCGKTMLIKDMLYHKTYNYQRVFIEGYKESKATKNDEYKYLFVF